jgi:hypothetical protein
MPAAHASNIKHETQTQAQVAGNTWQELGKDMMQDVKQFF